jgi:FecR protein
MKGVVALFLLLFIPSICYGVVGSITNLTAAVPQIQRDKTTLNGSKGTGVEMNDAIKTTAGKADITFVDETKVEVNENSKLVIDDFVYDPKSKSSGKLGLKFAQGTVRYASGAIAKNNPGNVNLNTPSATIAVRGTDFTSTVDEFGESTIILLPSCPDNYKDVETDCKTGIIEVYNDAGSVTLDKPFQGTKVANRNTPPVKPVTLSLSADQINNLLIISPPRELRKDKDYNNKKEDKTIAGDMLQVNYLEQDFLKPVLQTSQEIFGDNPLTQPILQQNFLEDIFNILSEQLQQESAQLLSNLLNAENQLLPDWFQASLVTKEVTPLDVTLMRNDGSDIVSVNVPRDQYTLMLMTQNGVTIKNRVNMNSPSTTIITRQN